MKFLTRFCVIPVCALGLSTVAWASQFTIKQIELVGLHRIQTKTVLHYLPVKAGSTYTNAVGNQILADLYRTGFFGDVSLSHSGGTLVVHLAELPAIGYVHIHGNHAIPKKQLAAIQQKAGLVLGRIFNQDELNALVQGMKHEYVSLGYYNASVTPVVTKMPRGMVSVVINVNQGSVAVVRQLQIIGNTHYAESRLLRIATLSTPNILSWITDSDHYSKEKLEQTLQALTDFYANEGYLRFAIISKNVQMSPDHKNVYITIHILPGNVYHFAGVKVTGVSAPMVQKLLPLVTDVAGDTFSRNAVLSGDKAIFDALGNQGFAFPHVKVMPEINDATHSVEINYQVSTGRVYYVRHIDFQGNSRTGNLVLRKMLRQMEGGVYSRAQVQDSKRRLANQPYLRNVSITTSRVSHQTNELDLHYHVKDVSAGKASFFGGYDDTYGLLYGINVSQANFLGTGKSVGIGFQRSAYSDSYYFNYNNPYYTLYGVSRGLQLFYTKTTPGAVNLSTYTQDTLGGTVTYGVPVSQYETLSFGYGYDYNRIGVSSTETPLEIIDYLHKQGTSKFYEIPLTGSWSYSDLNKFPMPTSGGSQSVSATLAVPAQQQSLTYYKLSYTGNWYLPIAHSYIFDLHTNLGYGSGFDGHGLPFYENYYAGGVSTVPGFTGNTLGPKVGSTYNGQKEPSSAVNTALGGNVMLTAGLGLIFPNHLSQSLRTSLTLNAGNVYDTKVHLNELRYSAGMLMTWYSPIGPLDFSLAWPLNAKPGDQLSPFQFTMGTTF